MRNRFQHILVIFMFFSCMLGFTDLVYSESAMENNLYSVNAMEITLSPNILSSGITINSKHPNNVTILKKGITSMKIGDYRNANEVKNTSVMYKGFQQSASGIALIYEEPEQKVNELHYLSYNGEKESIQLSYDYIGTYELIEESKTKLKKAGVCITLSNIIVGNSPKWTNDQLKRPWIECSNSFSDGIIYGNIKKMDAEFVFFDSDSGEKLDFSSSDKAFLSFSSLNAYPNASLVGEAEKRGRHEFVGSNNVSLLKDTRIAPNSLLSYHDEPSSLEENYDQHTFYAAKAIEGVDFTDYLNGQTFNRTTVQFPLRSIRNSFKFGSTYGRGWLTF